MREYDMNNTYRRGSEMQRVDALSRIVEKGDGKEKTDDELIKEAHEAVGHKGLYATKEKINRTQGRSMKSVKIKAYMKSCEKSIEQNDKRSKGYILVETAEPLEKVGMDICGPILDKYVLCMIDYYSRLARCYMLENRSAAEVFKSVKKFSGEVGVAKMEISDNALEFTGDKLKGLCVGRLCKIFARDINIRQRSRKGY
jgi:hypothetical protein